MWLVGWCACAFLLRVSASGCVLKPLLLVPCHLLPTAHAAQLSAVGACYCQGLDPASRRVLWDAVKAAKPGRAIILTTHNMEEAEVLCDRCGWVAAGLHVQHSVSGLRLGAATLLPTH